MRNHITKMIIDHVEVEEGELHQAIEGLPESCQSSFVRVDETEFGELWRGEFIISSKEAPMLADGDMVEEFAPFFPVLWSLKNYHEAKFELEIAVGDPAEEFFELGSGMVAILAALGASIQIETDRWFKECEHLGGD